MRYEYEGRVVSIENAMPRNEFDLKREATIEICDDIYMRFRVPRGEAGALYGKRVRVVVEVEK